MDPLEEIRSRISIEELVSQYVPLKKAGRQFKALCPFHQERTPSFYVSPERGLAYCFGCRKGGDHFSFIQEIEGLDFRGALKFLADKAGVALPSATPKTQQAKTERDRLIELHERAAAFFEEQLWETTEGKKVLKYVMKRDLKEETIKRAHLGFSGAEGSSLYTHLLEQNFSRSEILQAGLALSRDTAQGECFDRFRMRLMFPIHNLAGAICAFGGRAVRDGDEPKYLNSPETPIYHKAEVLYRLSESKPEIRRKDAVIVVEGYMDALALAQAGFQNVVACSGTALTEDQLRLIKRFTKNVLFAFDRDTAGQLATLRSIELALEAELMVRIVHWNSEAKDPDECIREDPKVFEQALASAPAILDYLLEFFSKSFDASSLEGKRKIYENLLPYLAKVRSPVELDLWLQKIASRVQISHSALYDELKRFQGKQISAAPSVPSTSTPVSVDPHIRHQEYLLGLILTYPEVRSIANQFIQPEDFDDIELQNIYRSLSTQYNQQRNEKRAQLLVMYAETFAHDMTFDAVVAEVKATFQTLKRAKREREKRALVERMRTAEGKDRRELLESYQQILSQEGP